MVKIQLYPQGTRVRIRRGSFPIDPTQTGRTGAVIQLLGVGGNRYGVQLDGEAGIVVFAEDELEPEEHRFTPEEAGEPRGGTGSDSPS